ncbi:cytochrome P450 [Nocardia sp. NBC_01327]|uniref:cytochrome P450 n=1 Tax=Nocardia sp. NBC_01327 TaxID=2903593 RepID=UPI002E106C70|nr:cytochrome P450 [Nocardia sp. NBC_01327]
MLTSAVAFDDSYFRDPHQFYRQVQQNGPIHRFTTPSGVHGWLVTSDRLARTVLTDPRIGKGRDTMLGVSTDDSASIGLQRRLLRYGTEWVVTHMLGSDPPEHTRLRRSVADYFTPRAVSTLEPRIRTLANEFVESMDSTAPVDLVSALACPLPVAVICEVTGISRHHQQRIERSSAILSDVTVAEGRQLRTASIDFARLILPTFAARRLRPRDDLITSLTRQMSAGAIDLKEALSTVSLLLIAGHETTSNLILGTMLSLLGNPDELQRVRSDPTRLNAVLDETLRTNPPLPVATLRQAQSNFDLAGQRINRGELLMVSLLAANHDPESVTDADTFDADRQVRHISFGTGIHHCLGARLARTEALAAITNLLEHYPTISLAVPAESLRWRRSIFFRRLEALPVHVSREAGQ